jgi:hypothetical protein
VSLIFCTVVYRNIMIIQQVQYGNMFLCEIKFKIKPAIDVGGNVTLQH